MKLGGPAIKNHCVDSGRLCRLCSALPYGHSVGNIRSFYARGCRGAWIALVVPTACRSEGTPRDVIANPQHDRTRAFLSKVL